MNEFYIRNVLEAALLAAGKPLQLAELGHLFDESARPPVDEIRAALDALTAEYANRSVEVKETAAGFRIQVKREFSTEVSRLWPERPARYTRALLETLALIAYRQPITRAEIEAVRGVAVNPNIVKTVIERNWVRVVGHRDVPGRPELLGTTREFLDYFGLRSLEELPPLAELKAMSDYNPQLELPSGAALGEPKADGASEGERAAEGGVPTEGAVPADGEVAAEGGRPAESEVSAEGVSPAEGGDAAMPVAGLLANEATVDTPAADAVADSNNDRTVAYGGVAGDEHPGAGGEYPSTDAGQPGVEALAQPDADATAQSNVDASEAEVERTLAAGEVAQHTLDSDDAETSEDAGETNDSLDPLEDAAEDDTDEDELSADGHVSRELVAARRDVDD